MGRVDNKDMNIIEILKEFYPNGMDKPYNKNKLRDEKLVASLINKTIFLNENCSFSERLYCLKNNIKPIKCDCGNPTTFKSSKSGYAEFCSRECMSKSDKVKSKRQQTNILLNGGIGFSSPKIREKVRKTNIEKYGYPIATQSKEIACKISETWNLLDKETILKKRKSTNLEKYGYEYHQQNKEQLQKIKLTCVKKYGGMGYASKLISQKCKHTNLELYGVDNVMKNTTIQNKFKKTMNERYNVNNISELGNEAWNEFKNTFNPKTFKLDKSLMEMELLYGVRYFTISNFLKQFGYEFSKTSSYELALRDFLPDTFIANDRKVLNGQELDFYSTKDKLAIEFNGLLYHSEKYNKNEFYHISKTDRCEELGIELIQIFEPEWLNKTNIIKSLINEKLNKFEYHINCGDCEVVSLEEADAKAFIKHNSISDRFGNINLGLEYHTEIVSILSLSFDIDTDTFEILNFCNKIFTKVDNSILLNKFKNEYNPSRIIVSVDRRYNNGDNYKLLGFNKISTTPADYFIVEKNKIFLKDEINFTEESNRIWDCGKNIFEYKK